MRIDLVLKHLCLAKSRSMVKGWCERGLVELNGEPARASASVHEGDRVTIHYPTRRLTLELREVPSRQVSKSRAPRHYDVVESITENPLED